MDKQVARQVEMDARHEETIAWRNSARAEDLSWRHTMRDEDKSWRETVREEDKIWRQSVRDEDKAQRLRTERIALRCCSLSAAAQSVQPGTSPDEIFSRALKFEQWLISQDD